MNEWERVTEGVGWVLFFSALYSVFWFLTGGCL